MVVGAGDLLLSNFLLLFLVSLETFDNIALLLSAAICIKSGKLILTNCIQNTTTVLCLLFN